MIKMPIIDPNNIEILLSKELLVSDLDGTLAPSKQPISDDMADAIASLLDHIKIAVIGGGRYEQFEQQLANKLNGDNLYNLYLFPTNASSLFIYREGKWVKEYEFSMSNEEKAQIIAALNRVIAMFDFARPKRLYGPQIEDRGTQITFSALGQLAPLEEKKLWDPDLSKRQIMKGELDKIIPEFEVKIGGTTSIDITRKGIDKAYGIRKIASYLNISISKMLYIGDAIFEGGNDYAALSTGVDCIKVADPSETLEVIKRLFAMFEH
jgi:HAD superfamily hydrolase (TIGR01484 family)